MPPVSFDGARLREDLNSIIESKELVLSNLQKAYLRSRWMELMLQTAAKYRRAVRSFYALRLATVISCLFILLLVSVDATSQREMWGIPARVLTIFFAMLVAACVAVEHLFEFGESRHRFGRVAERLKAEGWRFLQLSGPYQSYESHAEAFAAFANQAEALSQTGIEVYSFDVVRERQVASREGGGESPKKFFPLEGPEPAEPPAVMRSLISQH